MTDKVREDIFLEKLSRLLQENRANGVPIPKPSAGGSSAANNSSINRYAKTHSSQQPISKPKQDGRNPEARRGGNP